MLMAAPSMLLLRLRRLHCAAARRATPLRVYAMLLMPALILRSFTRHDKHLMLIRFRHTERRHGIFPRIDNTI